MTDAEQRCWACDRPLGAALDLTDDEVDALREHIMETEQEAPMHIAQHLGTILDKLPEHDILTRDPPAELRAELHLKYGRRDSQESGGGDA